MATPEEQLASLQKENDQLKAQLAAGPTGSTNYDEDVRSRAVREAEEMAAITPTPTQDELDQLKLGTAMADTSKTGAYKTRQSKPN